MTSSSGGGRTWSSSASRAGPGCGTASVTTTSSSARHRAGSGGPAARSAPTPSTSSVGRRSGRARGPRERRRPHHPDPGAGVGRQRPARLPGLRDDHPQPGPRRREPGLRAVELLGVHRCRLHVPPPALDRPDRHRARRRRGPARRCPGSASSCWPCRWCWAAPPGLAREPLFHRSDAWFPAMVAAVTLGSAADRRAARRARRPPPVERARLEPRRRERGALRGVGMLILLGNQDVVAYGLCLVSGPAVAVLWPSALRFRATPVVRAGTEAARVPRRGGPRAADRPGRAHRRPGGPGAGRRLTRRRSPPCSPRWRCSGRRTCWRWGWSPSSPRGWPTW